MAAENKVKLKTDKEMRTSYFYIQLNNINYSNFPLINKKH